MITNLWMVTTTFLGAYGPSKLFFASKAKAESFLKTLPNGEIDFVRFSSKENLNYTDGCTYNDLTFGGMIKVDMTID